MMIGQKEGIAQCAAGHWRPIKDAPFDQEILVRTAMDHCFVAIHYRRDPIIGNWWSGNNQAWSDEAFPGKWFAEINRSEPEVKS